MICDANSGLNTHACLFRFIYTMTFLPSEQGAVATLGEPKVWATTTCTESMHRHADTLICTTGDIAAGLRCIWTKVLV